MSKIPQPTISQSPPLGRLCQSNPHPWGLAYSSWINKPQKNNHTNQPIITNFWWQHIQDFHLDWLYISSWNVGFITIIVY